MHCLCVAYYWCYSSSRGFHQVWGSTAICAIYRANYLAFPERVYERGSSTIPTFRCKVKVQRERLTLSVYGELKHKEN